MCVKYIVTNQIIKSKQIVLEYSDEVLNLNGMSIPVSIIDSIRINENGIIASVSYDSEKMTAWLEKMDRQEKVK